MAASGSNTNTKQRVKIYRSNKDRQWDDLGTGFVTIDSSERDKDDNLCLYVIDEDDNATLLVHRISTEEIYKQEGDTIISWRDKERSARLALSFEDAAGCSHVWDEIATMQEMINYESLMNVMRPGKVTTSQDGNSELMELPKLMELPNVDLSTLPQILKIVTESGTTEMQLIALMLKDSEFFPKLMAVFETCETMNNVDGLHMMFNIVKKIISLNSSQILEIILGDQLILKIIGCLEYDPDVPQSQHHRNYLKEHVVWKEAIPIKDPLVLSKIHQTYIIGYLKDVVLTKVLDDATSAKLNSVIDANIATVITLLRNDGNIIQELVAMLRSPSTSVESRNNLVDFLHELCRSCKSLQKRQRRRLFRDLLDEGIFDIIAEVLQSPEKKLVLRGTDILSTLLKEDRTLLRSYVLRLETPLLGLLAKGLMEDFGENMQNQFLDLIQNIWTGGGAEQQRIIREIFYREHIPELVDFITASCPEMPGNTSEDASIRVGSHCRATPEVLLNICEFLCFCVRLDSSKNSYFLHIVTQKVLLLTRRKEKPVVAAAIRFLRTLLSGHSYIVENNTLKPIIDVFVADGHRDNLLNSAVLELLEHIRQYVVDTFWDQLAPFEDLASIRALKLRYDLCGKSSTTDPVYMRKNERALDKEASISASISQKEDAKPHDSNVVASIVHVLRAWRLLATSIRTKSLMDSLSQGFKSFSRPDKQWLHKLLEKLAS